MVGRKALLVVALCAAAACSHGGPKTGSALPVYPSSLSGFGPIPPGQQVESLDVEFENVTSAPITLLGVTMLGDGIGTVGGIRRMEAAPVPNVDVGTDWIPSGEWVTYPPVSSWFSGGCHVQRLAPLTDYVLRPRARIRVALLLEGLRPGVFDITGVIARYAQNRTTYDQPVAQGLRFTVVEGTLPRQVSASEKPCLSHTSVLPTGSS